MKVFYTLTAGLITAKLKTRLKQGETKMNRRINTDLLNDPFFIGFDTVFNKLSQFDKNPNVSNYPPYNLIKADDDSYVIELAVAGFEDGDINVEVHDGILTISANVGEYDDETEYLHKGIAKRSFVRKFTLSDTVEIKDASMHQGVLTIKLKNVVTEEKKPKKIPINNGAKTFLTEN